MIDALILEDNEFCREIIIKSSLIGKGDRKDIRYATNSTEFIALLNEPAKKYFLDDIVPNKNGKDERLFKFHYEMLRKKFPDAKVYYIGGAPTDTIKEYCKSMNVDIIEKKHVGENI